MVLLLKIFLLGLGVVPATAVTFTDVYNDFVVCDGDINSLITKFNQYPGPSSSPGASLAGIQLAVNKLTSDFNKAKSDIQVATPTPVPTADAQKIYGYLCANPIYPDLSKLITAIKAKRDAFASNGLKATVKDDCAKMKMATDATCDAILARAPNSTFKANFQQCCIKLAGLHTDCVGYYS